jgi:hypothetical protein
MTHTGNSNYRVWNKYYNFNTPAQNITFTFAKKSNGEPVQVDRVYSKLKTGDYVLSPYATWIIQFIPLPKVGGFNHLNKWHGAEIDLYLNGDGVYLDIGDDDATYRALKLNRYYKEDAELNRLIW